jgi:hypothetical protein
VDKKTKQLQIIADKLKEWESLRGHLAELSKAAEPMQKDYNPAATPSQDPDKAAAMANSVKPNSMDSAVSSAVNHPISALSNMFKTMKMKKASQVHPQDPKDHKEEIKEIESKVAKSGMHKVEYKKAKVYDGKQAADRAVAGVQRNRQPDHAPVAPGTKKMTVQDLIAEKANLPKSEELDKGRDEKGNPIRGSNKRYQQAKVFGTKSDTKTDKKGVHHSKIPDANGKRTSEQRMKMMNHIKDYAAKRMHMDMVTAQGKRDESGKLKNKAPIEKEPFDVFSHKGHQEEKMRQAKIDAHNEKLRPGQKPIKRVDPKPDHRSGKLETQPSPDAAIHELAHEALAPQGMSPAEHQVHMDKQWGESQSKHGHMQQKKTSGELQPMAAENKIRREIGLPANRTSQPVKNPNSPVERAIDNSSDRFVRAKDKSGKAVDLMRQSRLLSPANKDRIDQLRSGVLVHTGDKGIQPGTSIDAKINARAADHGMKVPENKKLAASELNKGALKEQFHPKDPVMNHGSQAPKAHEPEKQKAYQDKAQAFMKIHQHLKSKGLQKDNPAGIPKPKTYGNVKVIDKQNPVKDASGPKTDFGRVTVMGANAPIGVKAPSLSGDKPQSYESISNLTNMSSKNMKAPVQHAPSTSKPKQDKIYKPSLSGDIMSFTRKKKD